MVDWDLLSQIEGIWLIVISFESGSQEKILKYEDQP